MACIALRPQEAGVAQLTYTNAGHCPPVLLRGDGTIEVLEPTGGVLGVHEDFLYEERSLQLNRGDLILLYTDGLTEAEDAGGEQLGDSRLNDLIRKYKSDPIEALPELLHNEVQRFCGRHELEDDFTIIALRKV